MAHDHMDHDHDEDGEHTYGLALGFRIIEESGKLYLSEAEIAPYVDEPGELSVTLVFHPLEGLDPVEVDDDVDWPSWPIDIDDDLDRRPDDPTATQFTSIVRQLHDLTVDQLRTYLNQARENADSDS
jgi:hypothetical protein